MTVEPPAPVAVEWRSDDELHVDGQRLLARPGDRFRSDDETFLLVKPRRMIDRYERLARDLAPRRIVELGICEGGSTAFLALLCRPDRLVSLDIGARPVEPLEALIERRGLAEVVRPHYGVDQADVATLVRIVDEEFDAAPLDLVIDDASHRMGPTTASFNALFPRLRPGGVFVLEDWSGLHHYDRILTERLRDDPEMAASLSSSIDAGAVPITPLSVFVFQLVLASAYRPDVVAEIDVIDGWCAVTRGPAHLDESFELAGQFSDSAAALINPGSTAVGSE